MTDKPHALLLTPVLPLPTGSGRAMRSWVWLHHLGQTHEVHVLVCAPAPEDLPRDYPAASVRFIPARVPPGTRWRRRLTILFPFLVLLRGFGTDWLQLEDSRDLAACGLSEKKPDLVLVYRIYLDDIAAAILRECPDARTGIDLDDLESHTRLSVAGAMLRLGHPRKALRLAAISVQYAIAERLIAPRYDAAYVAAPEDIPRLGRRLSRKTGVFANRIGAPPAARSDAAPWRLLFTGTLNYQPNEEAVRFLVRDVAPLIGQLSGARLCIAGHRATAPLRGLLARHPDIELIEDADDLSPFFATALAVLVPLRAGGGTKLKTIEGFAHARPVISTSEGVRGLGAEAGRHYLAAQTPAEFAEAIIRIVRDPALADRIGQAGRALWQERFSIP